MEIKSEKKEFQQIDITLTSMREVELFLCFFNSSGERPANYLNVHKPPEAKIKDFTGEEVNKIITIDIWEKLKSYYNQFGGKA